MIYDLTTAHCTHVMIPGVLTNQLPQEHTIHSVVLEMSVVV